MNRFTKSWLSRSGTVALAAAVLPAAPAKSLQNDPDAKIGIEELEQREAEARQAERDRREKRRADLENHVEGARLAVTRAEAALDQAKTDLDAATGQLENAAAAYNLSNSYYEQCARMSMQQWADCLPARLAAYEAQQRANAAGYRRNQMVNVYNSQLSSLNRATSKLSRLESDLKKLAR